MTWPVYTTGRGYEEIRPRGRDGAGRGVKNHRLLAYAWGLLDGLDDPREVDHRVECRFLNIESNLQAVEPDAHGRRTRHREQQRRLDPEQYAETVEEVLQA